MAIGRKTGGRTKGTLNKSTTEIREALGALFTPEYFSGLQRRLDDGKLPPAVEAKLLAYRFGEPTQSLEFSGVVDTVSKVIHIHEQPRD